MSADEEARRAVRALRRSGATWPETAKAVLDAIEADGGWQAHAEAVRAIITTHWSTVERARSAGLPPAPYLRGRLEAQVGLSGRSWSVEVPGAVWGTFIADCRHCPWVGPAHTDGPGYSGARADAEFDAREHSRAGHPDDVRPVG